MAPHGTTRAALQIGVHRLRTVTVTRLVLIRHGESVAQAEGFHAGHAGCRGLSDLGRRQADALARRLARGELGTVHALYASEMERAIETASIIGPAIGHRVPEIDCGVCEIHPGDADGLTQEEVERRWPSEVDGLIERRIDNAESWDEMHQRVTTTLDRLALEHEGQTVVIACHGGVVAHAVLGHLKVPLDDDRAWLVATNTSMTELVLDPTLDDWRRGRWGIARYNDAAHLHELD